MSECVAIGLTPTDAEAEVIRLVEVVNIWKWQFVLMGVSSIVLEN
jgi:hypothetical protein